MQKQKERKSSVKSEEINLENFKEAETQPETRVVGLLYRSCCGCGCSDITIKREVPFDSPLQSGDRVETMLSTDTY